MSSSIESIVRPFQLPDPTPGKPVFQARKAAPQPVREQYGRGAGGRTFNGSASNSSSYYCTSYMNEKEDANWGTVF